MMKLSMATIVAGMLWPVSPCQPYVTMAQTRQDQAVESAIKVYWTRLWRFRPSRSRNRLLADAALASPSFRMSSKVGLLSVFGKVAGVILVRDEMLENGTLRCLPR